MIGGLPLAVAPVGDAPKAPPPFPVVKAPKTGVTTPPLPTAGAPADEEEAEPAGKDRSNLKRWSKLGGMGLAALITLGGVYLKVRRFIGNNNPPPPPVATKVVPVPKAAPAPAAAQPGPTPSDTLNAMAKAPVNAINKAQGVAAGQSDRKAGSDAVLGGELANKAASAAPAPGSAKAPASAAKSSTGMTSLSPGLSASTEVDAAAEATPAFRSFVANVKVSGAGIMQGVPRASINGRLTRAGEMVDTTLGITFDGLDIEKKTLIFKDRSGASVSRKY